MTVAIDGVDLALVLEFERIKRTQEQVAEAERIHRSLHELRRLANLEHTNKMLEAFEHYARAIRVPILKIVHYAVHRVQAHVVSKSKSSAKRKSSSTSGGSSGSSGGDGGDGDGPQRAPSKSKKSRSKPRSTPLQHPPSSPPGEIATTSSPQVSPHRPLPGREIVTLVILCLYGIANIVPNELLQGLVILCLLIIALVAMGYPEVARYVWSTVPKLLKQLATEADEESEDPDEES
jgi:hypothetical protein